MRTDGLVLRIVGGLILLAALAQWNESVRTDPGELDVLAGLVLPAAWGITGYGLFRLRDWARQLAVMACAALVLAALLNIIVERSMGGPAIVLLLVGSNGAFLMMSRVAVAAVRPPPPDFEPRIEGWLAASAGLIIFGSMWAVLVLPISVLMWNWYWGLGLLAKLLLFWIGGSYAVAVAWATASVPFMVANHFYRLAAEVSTAANTALDATT
jgi:hypothetical protein